MATVNVKISVTDVSDALALGQNEVVSDILSRSKAVVKNGGMVTLEYRYINAPSDIVVVYRTEQEIDQWKSRINEAQAILKRHAVA